MSEEGNTVDPSNVLAKRRQILEVTVGLGAASIAGVSSVRGQQPVKIQDWNDLNAVRDDLDGKYILDTDLDETTKGYDEHVRNPPEGWNPIKEFTGRFNGNNRQIKGLKIDRPETSVVGLFKSVNKGKITDLALTGLSVAGDEAVGGLAGIINGEVTNSLVSGEVTGQRYVGGLAGANGSEKVEGGKITGSSASSNITANEWAGGLVGVNWGGEIVESSASSDVTGDETVGGLAGTNIEEGRVSRSSATGNVTGEASVGGLIGVNNGGTVSESSATGEVSGEGAVGGLIGNNFEQPNGSIGKICDSFASGDVTGDDFVGGIVGINNGGEVSRTWACGVVTGTGSVGGLLGGNSSKLRAAYWDKNTTGQAEGIGQDRGDITGVVGLSTEEMTGDAAQENMNSLNFENIWKVTNSYPALAWQTNTERRDGSEQSTPAVGFDPAKHGFGFSNWPGKFGITVDGEQFEYTDNKLTREAVQRAIIEGWAIEGDDLLWSMLSRVLYAYLSSEAATNGHCYGMVFAAEEYFSDPDRLPDAADTASEVPKPTGDYVSVGDLIREYQTSQIISTAGPFFTNRALVNDSIDTAVALTELKTTLDQSGTAGVSFYSLGTGGIHDVLAYDYKELDDSLEIAVYDPNNPAASGDEITESYATSEVTDPATSFEVDPESGEIKRGYENDLTSGIPITYNRWAFSRPGLSLEVTEAMTGDIDQYLSQFRQGLFVGLNSPARLNIDGPADSTVVHPNTPVDASTTDGYHDFAYIVDATPGAYNVTVTGTGSGEYALDLYGIQGDESVITESVSGTITTNQVDEVNIELGTSEAETSIEINRDVDTETGDGTIIFGFTIEEVAVGGVASVAMAYATVRMLSDDEKGE